MKRRLNRNVLWHKCCKCVCLLNSSVCNTKQIWNSDICRCVCNEDFVGIINCIKGHMWNPSTCECQCDMWCKSGQYLDHKNCACKNELIGRFIAECTRVISETKMNDKMNIVNDDTTTNIFIGYILWATPSKLVNLLDFKPEKVSIETNCNNNNNNNNNIKSS